MPYTQSFIEKQFPVSKVSKESYKERKANLGQTLTGLGKWWGRKPLILVRSAILGLLMPSSDDPVKDREIFLKILTMDDEGLSIRRFKPIAQKDIFTYLTQSEKEIYFKPEEESLKIEFKKEITREDKKRLEQLVYNRMSYDVKLTYCKRPEEVELTDQAEWRKINDHLNTNAGSLTELIAQLGEKRFGHAPIVGDCFCGGGSVPFEAARMGCEAYASDLNPIAALLTWGALNINSASDEKVVEFREFQQKIYDLADQQVKEWGIEHNEQRWRAHSYLYCNETKCPECGWMVPMLPSMIIGKGTKTIAVLQEKDNNSFDIKIYSGVTKDEMALAANSATVSGGKLVCPNPNCQKETAIQAIRKDRKNADGNMEYGLRKWESNEFIPRNNDVFQERLYAIKYEETYIDEKGNERTRKHYVTPSENDLKREQKVIELLSERFKDWQAKGYIPKGQIEEGEKTNEPIRTRGWAYWHQLFNPRQLLVHGLLMELIDNYATTDVHKVIGLLGINKCSNWNSKLCQWLSDGGNEKGAQTFYNQALNSFNNYNARSLRTLNTCFFYNINNYNFDFHEKTTVIDARVLEDICDIWVTDPPYADAVNYHELSEFFLAWDKCLLPKIFPDWYTDSKRALAVKGTGESFNNSMIEVYRNLAEHMPEDGMQVVMFTHQDVKVWAELTLILWSAGLHVTAAWNIATETDSIGLKQGNYVKGTVLLVLRKQKSDRTAFLDEIFLDVEDEVKAQINSMRDLDDKEDPNFSDADYLLAAYAASVKILTSYKSLGGMDVSYELSKIRNSKEVTPIENIINEAVKIAYDCLIPSGFDAFTWKTLTPEERFYIKGLDFEKTNIKKMGAYQELARGFGVHEYKELMASTKPNNARLKTAMEFEMRGISSDDNFNTSLLRNILAALYLAVKDEDANKAKNWLKNELPDYWNARNSIIEILNFLITIEHIESMSHWEDEIKYAIFLKETLQSDGV